jgi:hypothetical protein
VAVNCEAERSARDGGVLVEGGSDDRRRVRRGPAAQGGQGGEEMVVDVGDRRLEEALTGEWRMTAWFGRNPMWANVL